jgi:hypothetical protein
MVSPRVRAGVGGSLLMISLLSAPLAARGGVVDIASSNRFVAVNATADDGTAQGQGPHDSNVKEASDNGPFTANLMADSMAPNGNHVSANASLDSTLTTNATGAVFNASGSAMVTVGGAQSAGTANATSFFDVTFDVNQTASFVLDYNPALQGVVPDLLFTGPTAPVVSGPGTFTGTFDPGEYELRANAIGRNNNGYSLVLTITSGGGGGGTSVPLPTALWSAAATIGLAGFWRAMRKGL